MEFAEIKQLLDKGFTPDQIMTLAATNSEKMPEVNKDAEPVDVRAEVEIAKPEPIDDRLNNRLNTLEKSINELTKTMQANAIMHDLQPGQSVKSDMEILASVLNPAGK